MQELISEKDIQKKVRQIAGQINSDYAGKDLVVVGVLKGSFIFLADLVRHITLSIEIDFIQAGSYGSSTTSSGIVKIKKDIEIKIEGRHVLLVEDIVDFGYTLDHLLKMLAQRKPASLKICALLNKPSRRVVEVPIDYVGFEVPDRFIVGYGLDKAEKYRNLPFIGKIR